MQSRKRQTIRYPSYLCYPTKNHTPYGYSPCAEQEEFSNEATESNDNVNYSFRSQSSRQKRRTSCKNNNYKKLKSEENCCDFGKSNELNPAKLAQLINHSIKEAVHNIVKDGHSPAAIKKDEAVVKRRNNKELAPLKARNKSRVASKRRSEPLMIPHAGDKKKANNSNNRPNVLKTDNRRMTGSVNIYICSEQQGSARKDNNFEKTSETPEIFSESAPTSSADDVSEESEVKSETNSHESLECTCNGSKSDFVPEETTPCNKLVPKFVIPEQQSKELIKKYPSMPSPDTRRVRTCQIVPPKSIIKENQIIVQRPKLKKLDDKKCNKDNENLMRRQVKPCKPTLKKPKVEKNDKAKGKLKTCREDKPKVFQQLTIHKALEKARLKREAETRRKNLDTVYEESEVKRKNHCCLKCNSTASCLCNRNNKESISSIKGRRRTSSVCIGCRGPKGECKCDFSNLGKLKPMICLYCEKAQGSCTCRLQRSRCLSNDDGFDNDKKNNEKVRKNKKNSLTKELDGCADEKINYKNEELPYQKLHVFSKVMNELQRKMSENAFCNICKNKACSCGKGETKRQNKCHYK